MTNNVSDLIFLIVHFTQNQYINTFINSYQANTLAEVGKLKKMQHYSTLLLIISLSVLRVLTFPKR